MWLSGIIAITNSSSDSTSPLNITLWIVVKFTLHVIVIFSINFMTSSDILYIFLQFIIYYCGTISCAFLLSYYYFYFTLMRFFFYARVGLWGFHWSLCDSKSPQVSITLFSISDRSQYCFCLDGHQSSSHFQVQQSVVVNLWVHWASRSQLLSPSLSCSSVFLSSQSSSRYLSLFLLSFSFTLWLNKTSKCTIWQVLFFR